VMEGGDRGDDLYGLGGNDTLTGDRASDCLAGGPGHDVLDDDDSPISMPDDIDTLLGGLGPDTLLAKDGDTLDLLNAGIGIGDQCFGDIVFSTPFRVAFDARINC
jgi:Ca2+-binding RTX toxin-like protein